MNPGRFSRGQLNPGVRFGLGGALLVGATGAAAALAAGWSPLAALYAAAAVGPSSTLLVLDALALRGEIAFPHGRLLIQGLLVQDVAVIALFAVLPYLPGAPQAAMAALAATAALAILAFAIARVTRGTRLWKLAPDPEVRNLLAFGLLFAFLLLAVFLGIPSPAGAFLAGLAIAAYPANVHLRPGIRAARDFFSPLFFVTLGALLPRPSLADVPVAVAFLAIFLIVKPLVLALLARSSGFTPRASSEAAALAAQGSEFALVLATTGVLVGDLTTGQFGTLVVPIALSMVLSSSAPRLVVDTLGRILPTPSPPPPVPRRGHVVVLGAGVTGRHLVEELQRRGEEVVAVDVDPVALTELPRSTPALSGDASDRRVLEAAHVQKARAVVCLLKSDQATVRVVKQLRGLGVVDGAGAITRVRTEGAGRNLQALGVAVVRRERLVADALERILEEPRGSEPAEGSGPA